MTGTLVLINLLGGVALLLWGLHMVRTGFTRAYGNAIRTFLGHSLDNRFKAFGAGLAVTLVLQSSTATSLLAASFAGRGLAQPLTVTEAQGLKLVNLQHDLLQLFDGNPGRFHDQTAGPVRTIAVPWFFRSG